MLRLGSYLVLVQGCLDTTSDGVIKVCDAISKNYNATRKCEFAEEELHVYCVLICYRQREVRMNSATFDSW